jgi:HAD superfamily hydrolase (TIGR01459 family)
MTQLYTNIASFSDKYAYFLLDLWGVIHDGTTVYPDVKECLIELRRQHKTVAFISNASLTERQLIAELDILGIDRQYYNFALTAGEVAHHILRTRCLTWVDMLGNNYFYIGPQNRKNLLADLKNYHKVNSLDKASFILNTGLYEEQPDIESYDPLFAKAQSLQLPMLCPNPDIIIVKSDLTTRICPGFIAKYYETNFGGKVIYVGKPDKAIYEHCMTSLQITDKRQVVTIGDTLQNDIQGGINIGIDSILVIGGVTRFELARNIPNPTYPDFVQHCQNLAIMPTAFLTNFVW